MNKHLKTPLLKLAILMGSIFIVFLGRRCEGEDTQKWLTHVPASEVKNTVIYQAMSDFGGKHYEATLYGRDLEGIPKWKEGTELPVSMLKVRNTAQKAFQQQFPQFSQFMLTSINVMHIALIDDWIIQAEFYDPNASGSEDKRIDLLELLNGRVVMPIETTK